MYKRQRIGYVYVIYGCIRYTPCTSRNNVIQNPLQAIVTGIALKSRPVVMFRSLQNISASSPSKMVTNMYTIGV